MKKWKTLVVCIVLTVLITGCTAAAPTTFVYDFTKSDHGWQGAFTDYPTAGDSELYDLQFEYAPLPEELALEGNGLMLKGANGSDDLFMYVRKQISDLTPDAEYRVVIRVTLATDAPAGAVGIGGPPGEAVYVKAGASTEEPVPVIDSMGGEPYYVLSVDKGSQSEGGANAVVIGNAAKEENDEFSVFELKTLSSEENALSVKTDSSGNAWIFVGTDSGFEGITELYYTEIVVELEEI